LRAIVAVLLDGAARASELCNLELSDVDLSNKRITIRDVEKKRDLLWLIICLPMRGAPDLMRPGSLSTLRARR
jgi:integrase